MRHIQNKTNKGVVIGNIAEQPTSESFFPIAMQPKTERLPYLTRPTASFNSHHKRDYKPKHKLAYAHRMLSKSIKRIYTVINHSTFFMNLQITFEMMKTFNHRHTLDATCFKAKLEARDTITE